MSSLLAQTKAILRQYKLRPQKRLGQSFLVDANILDKILTAALITPQDTVLEIGPGTGVLTEPLLARAHQVIAVEYDKGLYGYLEGKYKDNPKLVLVHGDYLKIDLAKLLSPSPPGVRVKVVSNLPYYISTPLLFKLLEERRFFAYAILMLQKEVVARLSASPGTKDYGALTLAVALNSLVEEVATISRRCFYPVPEVDSALIKLTFLQQPAAVVKDEAGFQQVVRAAFGQRRKTLYNALKVLETPPPGPLPSGFRAFGMNPASREGAKEWGQRLEKALKDAGIDGKRRGETLTLEEFARLANKISQLSP